MLGGLFICSAPALFDALNAQSSREFRTMTARIFASACAAFQNLQQSRRIVGIAWSHGREIQVIVDLEEQTDQTRSDTRRAFEGPDDSPGNGKRWRSRQRDQALVREIACAPFRGGRSADFAQQAA